MDMIESCAELFKFNLSHSKYHTSGLQVGVVRKDGFLPEVE